MARHGADAPAWARGKDIHLADPLNVQFGTGARQYLIACTVAGQRAVFTIRWRARDRVDAEDTFLQWLKDGWAIMNQTFYGEPCRYVFRTGAILGFFVLPD